MNLNIILLKNHLKLLLNQKIKNVEQKQINDDLSNSELFDGIAIDHDLNYYLAYSLYLIFKYSTSKMLFVNSFILFMKREFKIEKSIDLELRIDDNVTENELTKIKPNDLLKNLFDIYYQGENYYILYVDLELHSIKKTNGTKRN